MIYGVVTVNKDVSGRITIPFPYDSQLVSKIKKIAAHKLHPEEKHWSFLPEIYTHVSTKSIGKIKSQLDTLDLKTEGGIDKICQRERKF